MIYCFGDSWGYGSEMDLTYEIPFINILSKKTNIEFENMSREGCSLGNITHDIFWPENKFKSELQYFQNTSNEMYSSYTNFKSCFTYYYIVHIL